MNCPACRGTLTRVNVSGLTVDVCQGGCAGIWFDQAELRALDEPADKAVRFSSNLPVSRSSQWT
jgi:uncharacterized protein